MTKTHRVCSRLGNLLQARCPDEGAIMPEKSLRHVKIDDLARHVQSVLERADPPLPKSLIVQIGGMLRHCLRWQMLGNLAHPGMAKMAKMGKCSERQARRNIRVLEAWGAFNVTAYGKGGRWAPRYRVDLEALKQAMIAMRCNPSSELVEKMQSVRADMRADICPAMCPATMSAGIHIGYQSQFCGESCDG